MTDQDPTRAYQPPAAPPPASPPPAAAPPAPATDPAPGASPAPTAAPPAGTAPGRSRTRWVVAGVIALLVGAAALGATMLLTADSGSPTILGYVPADSVVYTELRLDLPGDQAAELAEVMQAFPGFEDQAAFPVKLSELMDQLVGRASEGKVAWKTDIEPWFGGQLGIAVGPLPASAEAEDGRAVALLSVKDAAMARAWLETMAGEQGATTAVETHNGVEITVVTPAGGATREVAAGWATTGPVLAIGDVASLRAAIDTGGTRGLASDSGFQAASATLPGDRLGFFWADLDAIMQAAGALGGAGGDDVPAMPAFLSELQVPWVVASVRAQDDAFVIDSRSPHVDAIGPSTAAESRLPARVPPTTVLLASGHEVGATLAELKALLAEEPELADAVKQVDDTLGILGGFEAVTGWMGEAGIAVTREGTDVAGGLVITPTDAAAAERLMNQLKAFVQLGGAELGLTVTDETHGDATITVVDLSALAGLAGGMTGGEVPVPADLSLAYAVTDEVVVLGYGTGFVKAVLDARSGESLATTERFKADLARAGAAHASLLWLDVTGVRGAVEAMAPAEMLGQDYATEVKPYLEAIDTVISVNIPGETIDQGTVIIRTTGD